MPELADVQRLIEDALPGAVVTVEDFAGGGGDHLAVRVTAPQFAGRPLLEQHRMVYGAVEAGARLGRHPRTLNQDRRSRVGAAPCP